MMNTAFCLWPSFNTEEADALGQSCATSNLMNYWIGTECRDFQREFALWTRVGQALALTNGALVFDVALRATGIGPGNQSP